MDQEVSIWWIRRDLRLDDNQSLMSALTSGYPVVPIFIFDDEILEGLDPKDHRVEFLVREINRLGQEIRQAGATLEIFRGHPAEIFKKLHSRYRIKSVYAGRDYEPYAIQRDKMVEVLLSDIGATMYLSDDHMIMPPDSVVKSDGSPYTVFTPYKNRWIDQYKQHPPKLSDSKQYLSALLKNDVEFQEISGLEGFDRHSFDFPSREFDRYLISDYDKTRDVPSVNGTSRLGIHLRFGTISVRKLASMAGQTNQTFLNELIWREFYQMVLFFYPSVVTRSFKAQYDRIAWLNRERDIDLWCVGRTGYPIVDAGIRELLATGFMHNRVRMITASFLTKHLLVDWRVGEAFFARHLLDYELASNNGGWQWAAGTGCDAAPYFRVFNPDLQTKKFDPDNKYILRWVPESVSPGGYVPRVVDHAMARERALKTYSKALKGHDE